MSSVPAFMVSYSSFKDTARLSAERYSCSLWNCESIGSSTWSNGPVPADIQFLLQVKNLFIHVSQQVRPEDGDSPG